MNLFRLAVELRLMSQNAYEKGRLYRVRSLGCALSQLLELAYYGAVLIKFYVYNPYLWIESGVARLKAYSCQGSMISKMPNAMAFLVSLELMYRQNHALFSSGVRFSIWL